MRSSAPAASARGRPSLYHPDLSERARGHLRQGATLAQLAALLGVSARSIDNWVARIPEFAAAVRDGRAEADAALDRLLYQRAVGFSRPVERVVRCRGRFEVVRYTKHHAPDAQACMRFLCRRAPQDWRRRPDLPSKRAVQDAGVNRAHLLDREVVEVVSSLHAIACGYVLPVERVFVWFGEPVIVRTTRHLPPHVRAGMFWLCNRLPEQWSYAPLASARRSAPLGSSPEAGQEPEGRGVNRAHLFPAGAALAALAPVREEGSGRHPERSRPKDGAVEGPAPVAPAAEKAAPRPAGFIPSDVEPRWGGFERRLPRRAAWHRRAVAQVGVTAGDGASGRTVDVPFAIGFGPRTSLRRSSTAWDEFATVVPSLSPRPPCSPVAARASKVPIDRPGGARFDAR